MMHKHNIYAFWQIKFLMKLRWENIHKSIFICIVFLKD